MSLRSYDFLRAPALAAAGQVLPIAPQDVVLLAAAVRVWVLDIRDLARRTGHAWRTSALAFAATGMLSAVVQPQRLSLPVLFATAQSDQRATWDGDTSSRSAIHQG